MAADSDYKLCGFLAAVVTTSVPPPYSAATDLPRILPLNTPCHVFKNGPDVGFESADGFILSLIKSEASNANSHGGGAGAGASSSKKKLSRFELVHGSVSVVHQLYNLVTKKCVKITARVIRIAVRDCGEVRVVVLVDVYLPIEVWSGWQFPRSRSTAAALFRHLSCDWKARSIMLECEKPDHAHNDNIWNISDCHVLGCNQHRNALDSSKRKLFELHEIFKSLPTALKQRNSNSSGVHPEDSGAPGFWVLPDDVLMSILTLLGPLDLHRVSSTCHHLRFLAATVMPCMKLKLFPHQQAAVEWMLKREREPEVLPNPLYLNFVTEDEFSFNMNTVTGEVVTGTVPTIRDFRGGMFCDEPGLGKTITALSLILKTQGTLADPPEGVEINWCKHNGDQKCGYYELSSDSFNCGSVLSKKNSVGRSLRRGLLSLEKISPKEGIKWASSEEEKTSVDSKPATSSVRCTRSWTSVKRNLLHAYKEPSDFPSDIQVRGNSRKRKHASVGTRRSSQEIKGDLSCISESFSSKRTKNATGSVFVLNETWVQCDSCRKWRRLVDASATDNSTAWFCSMNSDPFYQSCSSPEEAWSYHHSVTYLPGFYTKGTSEGKEENVAFFISVLKEHYALLNSETKKALIWLARLSPDKLSEMETVGLLHPLTVTQTRVRCLGDSHGFHKIFQAFGLFKKVEQGTTRWYYPKHLANLAFDLAALRLALCEPLDSFRLYLSRATLVVVPSNLVDHWKTQIQKHVRAGQLRVYVWTDHKKPSAHNLAWDYDVVITTFSRLSAEWSPNKRSVLMQVHWLRIMFDEGHTLGSNLNLTNKLQISVSLAASNRWLLTGTPTPNTPNSQLSHLQTMFKFLREEAYGQDQNLWEVGILRPFEAEMEEGRSRLLQLLRRCMISARKSDLHMIPPCIKKVTFLDFNEEHARSYNELVVTVRRNILMADWNDPSHVESLLNPKQWKFRTTTIRNVRLSCCVAGHVKVTDAGQDIQETMDILVKKGLDRPSQEYSLIEYYLQNGGDCWRCNEWCRLPVITPCRHLLCLDCVAMDSERCTFPGCGNLYEMQTPETLARPENPNPKWPVPKDLIELQPSYKQDDWNPDWQSTSSSKVSYLVLRLKELQEANSAMNYSEDESNGATEINELPSPSQKTTRIWTEKVLIFSQFLEHIHVIEQQLKIAGIKFVGMYSPMHSINKMKSLAIFQRDVDCTALLMDGSAALGLDLSFVTHVFLMEPIWDRSMEEQVISRAHRMGASRPIHVETLAMHGTIEEQMLKFLQDADECRRFLKEEYGKLAHEGTRAQHTLHDFAESNYLARLSFVRKIARKEGA